MPAAVLGAAGVAAGRGHPLELLGRVHADMDMEAPGDHRGLCRDGRLGPQPSVQVSTPCPDAVGQWSVQALCVQLPLSTKYLPTIYVY